jgi:hypothetical protein
MAGLMPARGDDGAIGGSTQVGQGLQGPVHLGSGVVMHQAEAQDATGLRLAEPLDETGRVKSPSGEDALRAGPSRPLWEVRLDEMDTVRTRDWKAFRSVIPWMTIPSSASRPSISRVTSARSYAAMAVMPATSSRRRSLACSAPGAPATSP